MKSLSICIVGPTAVGKTGVAVEIAKRLGGEVIGLDSRQIYRHMAIGTAQPTEKEQHGISHHLYGVREPGERISAGEYSHLVEEKVKEITARGNLSIICGGSGLYFRAITKGIFEDSTTDLIVREKLTKRLDDIFLAPDKEVGFNRLQAFINDLSEKYPAAAGFFVSPTLLDNFL